MLGEQGYMRQFEKFSKPLIKTLVTKGYQLESEKVTESKARMTELIEQLNSALIKMEDVTLLVTV